MATMLAAAAGGCDDGVAVRNAAPAATWLAVQPPEEGVAETTLWVFDRDGDPVDVSMRWRREGTEEGTPVALAPGGHGLVGLTTRVGTVRPQGEPHHVRWRVDEVPQDATIRLIVEPDDREAGAGRTVRTPPFTLAEGLPEAVPLEPTPREGASAAGER